LISNIVPRSQVAARFDGSKDAHQAKIKELEGKIADAKKREAEKQAGWKGKVSSVRAWQWLVGFTAGV
jgi:hypothetical protein